MIVTPVGTRGSIITFDDNISVYHIAGGRFHLLCDTHLGSGSMDQVIRYLNMPDPDQMIIFNSHSDWDHIWGNCSFSDSIIIGHELCRKRMRERWDVDFAMNASQQQGHVEPVPPNLTFSDRLCLEEEGIGFSYAPGHTIDSSICYDMQDRVLYVGDLVEDPIPYLDDPDLTRYLVTLQVLLDHQAEILISAHSGVVSRDLIRENMAYIMKIRDGIPIEGQVFGEYAPVHRWNLNMQILHRYESQIRTIQGDTYSCSGLLAAAGDLHTLSADELTTKVTDYLSRIA